MVKTPCWICGREYAADAAGFGRLGLCSWACRVEDFKRAGYVEVRPNGLPVVCATAQGTLLECEHGDHPTYLFPVEATGEEHPEDLAHDFHMFPEQHALIYTDGHVALTLYECCYAIWYVRDGEWLGGSLDRKGVRLTEESLEKIRAHVAATKAP
jgi:hypothetical protein